MRNFNDSTTIKAAKRVENKSNLGSSIAIASTALAPLLLTEIGIRGVANEAIINATDGAIRGEAIESILLSTGLIVASRLLEKKANKKLATDIVIGRLNAKPIDKDTIPNEYNRKF